MTPDKSPPIHFTSRPLEDYRAHRDSIQHALQRSLELGHYILGSEVATFEQEFASFAHSIGVANGTNAIELLLRALDINEGSSVAVPSQTAVASVSANHSLAFKRTVMDQIARDLVPGDELSVEENFFGNVNGLNTVFRHE